MLTALALGLALLGLLALAALPLAGHRLAGRIVHGGCCVVSAGFALAALGGMAFGLPEEPLRLPFGPAWAGMSLAMDGLSAWFLLLLGLAGVATSLFALGGAPRGLVAWPIFLGAMALALLAADGFTLLLGFEAMSLASWALVALDHREAGNRAAARLYLIVAALAAACLLPCFGLLGAMDFAAIRAAPPEGWRAVAVLALGLVGAGAKAGLVPLHAWLPLAHPAAPSHVSALMSGAMTKVALYVMARLLLDLCGPVQPGWWGLPLLVLGVASAVLGALRANLEEDTKVLLACSTIENVGLVVVGLGLALLFRGADLGAMAALAAGAALLHAMAHGLFKTLLFLVAGAIQHAAGSRRLDRLGGLIHAMPRTALAAAIGLGAAAGLPPLSGFASEWLLLQSLLAGWRLGEIGLQMAAAAALALAAMAVALAAAAMLRFFGLVFLGRPRSPRGAGAREMGRLQVVAMLLPAGLTVLLGLFPALALELAGEGIRQLVGPMVRPPVIGLALGAGEGHSTYAPLAVALLIGLALMLLWAVVRWRSPAIADRGPVWNGGFIDPPAELIFGDPLSQPSAAGMAQPLRRMLGGTLLAARERVTLPPPGDPRPARLEAGFEDRIGMAPLTPAARIRDAVAAQVERLRSLTIRGSLSLVFATLVGLLALVAWLEGR
ncbi:proton-conducting transporter transmembrane domain-containing protein [Belnapia rosea]|uniref:Formate hydrogenlyase subunit 3/Multisubunit Na+/H+ antiporter, MnhD subunit n=1 Tax=Belnapia rosea TaxID=938405 RepID=A0A1G6XEG2_9PROT|nr:proton-conducting transporter membrane subunit [Belnapia rosea]SDD76550.1 Formate hydrogenlyase subunit 3/Multisubunit Na+/H+ antiporter, MnhD subunit [Belnapia rosea]